MATMRRLKQFAIGTALAAAALLAQAGLITQSGTRSYGASGGGGGGGDWADVFVAVSGAPAELGTNGRIVGIDGDDIADWAPNITFPESGCELNFLSGGAYDGENAVELVSPSSGEQPADCGIVGMNVTNSGANNVAQLNVRFVAVFGSRYIDLASGTKWICLGLSSTPGGGRENRACAFEQYEPNGSFANGRIFALTVDEIQSWHEPEITDCYHPDCGNPTQKSFIIRTSANHGGSPPVAGPNEPIYFELELDVRQNRGNANGRNKLYVRTRDGLINKQIDIPLSWDGGWNFGLDQIIEIEGLGWYWNTAGTANADNKVTYSHIAVSSNRSVDSPIGPPPGFNTGWLLLLVIRASWLRQISSRRLRC